MLKNALKIFSKSICSVSLSLSLDILAFCKSLLKAIFYPP